MDRPKSSNTRPRSRKRGAKEALTDAEADRLAARIRPSWAPSLPPPPGPAHGPPPSDGSGAASPSLDESQAGTWLRQSARQKRMATGAVVAVCGSLCGLLAWAIMGTRAQPPLDLSADATALSAPDGVKRTTRSSMLPATGLPSASPIREHAAEAHRTTSTGPAKEPAATVHSVDVAAVVQTQPDVVSLKISTSPVHARVQLDGQPVTNPFAGPVLKNKKVRVRVDAPGYHSETVTVFTDRARVIGIALQRR